MLSVCFITKNEEAHLGECIEHLRPVVSDFVVVDTGSTDRTLEIAQEADARIDTFNWVDDFSKARNFAISKAKAPWILHIDPDERIDPKDFDALKEVLNREELAFKIPSRTYSRDLHSMNQSYYQRCQGDYLDQEQSFCGFNLTIGVRIFRNDPKIFYKGRVHETITHSLPQDYVIPEVERPVLHHFGYTEEVLSKKNKKDFYQKILKKEDPQSEQFWFAQFTLGCELLHEARPEQAIACFERALTHRPKYPDLLCNYGYALTLIGNYEKALITLKKCLRLHPHFDLAWSNLGILYLEAGNLELAVYALDRSLDLNPNLTNSRRAKAQALGRLNRIAEAEREFLEILQSNPDHINAMVDLAMLYIQTERQSQGEHILNQALQRHPDDYRGQKLLEQIHALRKT